MPSFNKETHTSAEIQFINNVGFKIQYTRKRKWLSQAELAEKSGLSPGTIFNLESSTPYGLSLITLYRISQALEIDLNQLLTFN
jgi:transcriptional regulator with XRE-family HTH domain